MTVEQVFFVIEITGTVVYAISGVMVALEKRLDIFGATVLALATSIGGGLVRDLILGYIPPFAFRKPIFSATAIIVALLCFAVVYFKFNKVEPHIDFYKQLMNIFDSIGLAVFTIDGVNSAHSCGYVDSIYICVFVGVLTGVGGGMIRDVLSGKIPAIMSKRIYALAAAAGAVVYQVIIEHSLIANKTIAIAIGTGTIIIIRALATVFRWNLPRLKIKSEDNPQ